MIAAALLQTQDVLRCVCAIYRGKLCAFTHSEGWQKNRSAQLFHPHQVYTQSGTGKYVFLSLKLDEQGAYDIICITESGRIYKVEKKCEIVP